MELLEGEGLEYLIVSERHLYLKPGSHRLCEFFEGFTGTDILTFDFDLEEALSEAIKIEAIAEGAQRARVISTVCDLLAPAITCDNHDGGGTFELYPTAISKARGIQVALDRLGIDRSHAYAFGDGTNDLEMIAYCGCGVAMANAEKRVRDAADIVCPPVWEDGLAQVLRQLF